MPLRTAPVEPARARSALRGRTAAGHSVPDRPSARERLLSAALARFVEEGALAATLEDIRRDAGVSTGALYHHFSDKAALAAALYVELTAEFQEGFLRELRAHPGAEEGVRAGVRFYLRWVSANRAAASFLLGERPAGDAALAEQNRSFFAQALAWWDGHVHYGVLCELPIDLINALWLGPAQEYTRHWIAGRGRRVPLAAAEVLADAAWRSVRVGEAGGTKEAR